MPQGEGSELKWISRPAERDPMGNTQSLNPASLMSPPTLERVASKCSGPAAQIVGENEAYVASPECSQH